MTSPKDRRIVRQGSLERQGSKGDDPWCLTCGANLALEGRTFILVSRHNHGDLCDIFSRVLGAEFSPGYASLNVCNRCERQLRRLGRYNSIILARHEGAKLREQLEKNLARHGQKIIESGDIQDLHSPTSDTTVQPTRSETFTSAGNRQSYEGHSSLKKFGKTSSKSVSSVHFEDEPRASRIPALRKFSAPDGGVRKRESLSPFSEAERRREARRRKWSSASSTSEENTPISPTGSADRKLSQEGRGVALTSHTNKEKSHRSNQRMDSLDQQNISDQQALDSSSMPQEQTGQVTGDLPAAEEEMTSHADQNALPERSKSCEEAGSAEKTEQRKLHSLGFMPSDSAALDRNADEVVSDDVRRSQGEAGSTDVREEEEQTSKKDAESSDVWSERINPFGSDKKKMNVAPSFDTAVSFDDDVFVVGSGESERVRKRRPPKTDTLQADDELFKKLDEASLTSESETDEEEEEGEEEEEDPSDYNADARSNISEVEERINTKTKFKGAYYNIGSTEDLLQEFANEQDRERARWSQLTFTESMDVEDTSNPLRPARRPKPKRRKKGRKQQGCVETIPEGQDAKTPTDPASPEGESGTAETQDNGVAVNGPLQGVTTSVRSEKSPLIGKESGSPNAQLKTGSESTLRDQQPGFLCCAIL